MWKKVAQRKLYSFLSSRWSDVSIAISIITAVLVMVLAMSHFFSEREQTCASIDFTDNIMERSYERDLYFEPIDIVYVMMVIVMTMLHLYYV